MSNPAVVKLQRKIINGQNVWIDDNFGESVHLHIDRIRVDMSITEYEKLCDDLCDILNELLQVPKLDIRMIDKTFLEYMFWKNLTDIKDVEIDRVLLSKLLCPNKNVLVPLPLSRGVRALRGDTKENDEIRPSHHIGQTSENRLNRVMKGIQEHPYPYKGQYIVVYNDDYVIMDGQHRASCLYHLYGDVEVDVMRIKFHKKTVKLKYCGKLARSILKNKALRFFYHFAKNLLHPRKMYNFLKDKIFMARRWAEEKKRARFLKKHMKERDGLIRLLSEK